MSSPLKPPSLVRSQLATLPPPGVEGGAHSTTLSQALLLHLPLHFPSGDALEVVTGSKSCSWVLRISLESCVLIDSLSTQYVTLLM